jgi:FtsP/CotA-like multicopper oxidase with cupredoxin domain
MEPFHWLDGATVVANATTSSTDYPLLKVPTGRTQLRFYNAGAVPVFIRKGSGGVAATATVTDLPIAPGSIEVLSVVNSPNAPITSIGTITASGSATLYITTGVGI